ncbi:hypothetical protein [Dysgonomonas sp. 25]|uniref:hypothetical protein n=1 Tax=Dysgonomonas sp. 25 TaxID=2302933 RepID=UPI0013D65DD5|nr:hypothetical protein [Dysgonomonas sp. 25]NDV68769.1 hypothetical protein [Dysgonomonas sp. 25]
MAKTRCNNPDRIERIRKIISDSFLAKDQTKILEDKSCDAGHSFYMERKIVPFSESEYVLYRFDPDESDIFPYFKETKDLKKICDYVLFVEHGDAFYTFLIELKWGSKSSLKQLEASEMFIKHILEHAGRIDYCIENPIYRKIRINESQAKGKIKGTTKVKELTFDENNILVYTRMTDFRIKEILHCNNRVS